MSLGGIKKYHLVHLDFEKNICRIFAYEKDRRLTAKQAWSFIFHSEPTLTETLPNRATIADYFSIINNHGFNERYCDRYCSFKGF